MLGSMIDAGVNVFRLNFSHGTLDTHAEMLKRIRQTAADRAAVVAIMGDLCGPKIRLNKIDGGRCQLDKGATVVFERGDAVGNPGRLTCSYPALIDDVEAGHRLLIDDGNVQLRAVRKSSNELVCTVEVGGVVSDRKGINLPDSHVSSPALTDKDRGDLEWAIAHEVDYVALSFVRRPEDLTQLRKIITKHQSRVQIVSKIEKPEAVGCLEPVIEQSDVVLVARGDLGVEMDVSRVPLIQKEICLLCRRVGKPVIVATQMLQSMVEAPVPTRAEVSDVANAILDDADAVMLSAETSVGKNPLAAVQMIKRIAEQTEAFRTDFRDQLDDDAKMRISVDTALTDGAAVVAERLGTRLVAIWSRGSDSARLLSKHRVSPPLVAITDDERVCRQMALFYGVIPVFHKTADHLSRIPGLLDAILVERKLASPGDRVVVTVDTRPDLPGETDALFIHVVGSAPAATGASGASGPGR
jgi:pyruvate kinase